MQVGGGKNRNRDRLRCGYAVTVFERGNTMQKDVINVPCPRCKAKPGEQCGGRAQPDSAGNRVHIPRVDQYIRAFNLASDAWGHLKISAENVAVGQTDPERIKYHREQFEKKLAKARRLMKPLAV
ncbi:hypothetical protein HWC69_gp093 [Gordonia phage Ranch]|uniref:DNA-binding phage zinc finger domain-containing protein n=1 Tax=Gordonia phage Ranch TaxID=2599848 RepID=A0A5J6TUR0_9CAUD|nr:hypothetical protein HWC69_gp093 [Gordonia phage Ranch]QFG12412.1 hypothetical protein PBI_RANCH_93 [Gordonia phage Ranch]